MFDFIFIGNEHPIKGLDIVDDIIASCANTYNIVLVGNLPKLKEKYNGLNGVHFTGPLYGTDKSLMLTASDLLFLPSYQESFSMVAAEALYFGTPVVAFDMPTLRSIYKKGVVFAKYGDSMDMFSKMTQIVNNHRLLAKLSEDAIKQSKEFSWDKSAKEVLCALS